MFKKIEHERKSKTNKAQRNTVSSQALPVCVCVCVKVKGMFTQIETLSVKK